MLTLELTIQRKTDDGWPLIAEQIRPGFLPIRSEGLLALDQRMLLRAVTPRAYGTLLGEALFQGPIRDAFVRALAESNEDMRVLLFVETDELRVLRWERLCAPFAGENGNGWDFLLLNQRTLFSLYLPSLTDRRYPPIGRRDLRALVLIACPSGLDQYGLVDFNAAATAGQVRQALGGIPFDLLTSPAAYTDGDMDVAGNGVPEAVGPASLDALCQRLTEQPYTLVHVVCHGHYDHKSGETSLFLANSDHELARVTATQLLERLGRLGRLRGRRGLPHFAFLATCDSAAPEAEGALGGLAQRLVRELGMPAVIAMTEKVSITTAQLLTGSFYAHLQKHGEVDRALVEATNAIAERSDVTVPAIYSRLGGQPLFSQSLDRELTVMEIADGLDTLGKLVAERAPVLETEFQFAADGWRRYLERDQLSLTDAQVMERRNAQMTVEQIADSAIELSFKALCLGNAPPAYDARCPFRGLIAFGVADQPFFFGREGLVEQVRERLAHQPFLAILGPSGSGKSSLVLAGLIPALQKQYATIAVHVMTPGAEPVVALAVAVAQLGVDQEEVAQPTLLVVDQFEESFTLCTDESLRRRFFQQLLALVAPGGGTDSAKGAQPPPRVILTMRADFWGECASYPPLRDRMLAHQLLIGPMTSSELRAAMEQQARTVGLRFEADLANTILDDVAGEPGAMPLLQHGLRALWQRRYGRWLPAVAYREMGGIKRAVAGSAEAIYQGLFAADQERMRALLLRLTRLDEEALPGETRRDTRRRVVVDELIPTAEERPPIMALIQQLAAARLLVTSHNTQTDQEEVEVAHEALIREWPRLRDWLEEDLESGRIFRQIRDAAVVWRTETYSDSYLYQGQRLNRARKWLHEHPGRISLTEREFLDASVKHTRINQLRWVTRALLIFAVPILVYLFFAGQTERWPFEPPIIHWESIAELRNIRTSETIWSGDNAVYVGLMDEAKIAVLNRNGQFQTERYIESGVGVNDLFLDPVTPQRMYAFDKKGVGLVRSEDDGQTWVPINDSSQEVKIDITISSAGDLYVGDVMGRIWRRDRGEVGWQPIADGPFNQIRSLNWLDEQLYVGASDGLYLWSPDGQWQQIAPESPLRNVFSVEQAGEWIVAGGLLEASAIHTNGNIQSIITTTIVSSLVLNESTPVYIGGTTAGTLVWWRSDLSRAQTFASNTDLGQSRNVFSIQVEPVEHRTILWVNTDKGLWKADITEWLHYQMK